jgi:hypothetical protein
MAVLNKNLEKRSVVLEKSKKPIGYFAFLLVPQPVVCCDFSKAGIYGANRGYFNLPAGLFFSYFYATLKNIKKWGLLFFHISKIFKRLQLLLLHLLFHYHYRFLGLQLVILVS